MSVRGRFISTWNSLALLFFFADIFLEIRFFGYSGIMVAIFMWVTGGIFASIIFGDGKSGRKRRKRVNVDQEDQGTKTSKTQKPVEEQFCTACGTRYGLYAQYCPECGTASLPKAENNEFK